MENKVERVVIETDRHRIIGDVTLPREGYRSRFSEYLTRGDVDFIPMVNVELSPLNGGSPESRPFIAVARTQVQLAFPYEEE